MDADDRQPEAILFIAPAVRRSGSVCLEVAGDIDMTTGDQFTRALTRVLDEPGIHTVVLNIGQLHFIDSSGVTALIRTHWTARERGILLTVSDAGGPIRETLEMLGVYEVLAFRSGPPPGKPGPGQDPSPGHEPGE
jgi:anti-anti-sigma factor